MTRRVGQGPRGQRAASAARAAAAGLLAGVVHMGCGGQPMPELTWVDGTHERSVGVEPVRVRWTAELAPRFGGAYVPVERAGAALDRRAGKLYAGSNSGTLWAFSSEGRELYRYDAGAGIEAPPALDAARGELYVANVRGEVHALVVGDATLRWKANVGEPVSQPAILADDVLYWVTDDDSVVAVSRDKGEVLWRYRREPVEGFSIAGHAGLTQQGRWLFTGFTDGVVVALDAADGSVRWELDTSLDLSGPADDPGRFVDVDTAPLVLQDTLYAASFSGGLYGIDPSSGEVRFRRPELTGVTGLAVAEGALLVSSADHGLVCLDLPELGVRWHRPPGQGVPGTAQAMGSVVFVAESRGALLALALSDGHEVGRVQASHGFSALPVMEEGRGFILSNAGRLFAFVY